MGGPKYKWIVDLPPDLYLKLEKKREGMSRREFLELVAEYDKLDELVRLKKRVKELEREIEILRAKYEALKVAMVQT